MRSLKPALPERYCGEWRGPFDARIACALRPGVHILDVGSGRNPSLAPAHRPPGCHYAELDISAAELGRAAPGSYDERWVQDVTDRVPELEGRFDLIVSWQVLEHVKPLDRALANLHAYLRPGGRLVALFSGTFSAFGLMNGVVPRRIGVWMLQMCMHRDPETVFPAHYHRCWHGAVQRMLAPWAETEIVPLYVGAVYLGFSGLLQRLYLVYEDWAVRGSHRNLATHYLVTAVR